MLETRLSARVLALVAALGPSSCAATFTEPRTARSESRSVWASYYVVGIIGREEVDVREHCPSGQASEVETGATLATLGVSLLTIGIYTPRRVLITCAPARKP
jgi:hypothetical protein